MEVYLKLIKFGFILGERIVYDVRLKNNILFVFKDMIIILWWVCKLLECIYKKRVFGLNYVVRIYKLYNFFLIKLIF